LDAFGGEFLPDERSSQDAVVLADFYPLDRAEDELREKGCKDDFCFKEGEAVSGTRRTSEGEGHEVRETGERWGRGTSRKGSPTIRVELSRVGAPDILGHVDPFHRDVDEAALLDAYVLVLADDLAIAEDDGR